MVITKISCLTEMRGTTIEGCILFFADRFILHAIVTRHLRWHSDQLRVRVGKRFLQFFSSGTVRNGLLILPHRSGVSAWIFSGLADTSASVAASRLRFSSNAFGPDRTNMTGWSLADLRLVGRMAKVQGISVVALHDPPLSDPLDPLTPTRVAFCQRGEGEQLFAHHQ